VSEGSTYLRAAGFCCRDLDINPMTLKLEGDLDILKMHLHTENEVAGLRHSKLLIMDEIYMANVKNTKTALKVKVTNLQKLLACTTGHIRTKLHQFLISSFRDFVRTDTDRQTPPKTIPVRSRRAGKNNKTNPKKKLFKRKKRKNVTNKPQLTRKNLLNACMHCALEGSNQQFIHLNENAFVLTYSADKAVTTIFNTQRHIEKF